MNKLSTLWNAIVKWFEYGDLVPLLVTVSAVHYIDVLDSKDQWYVAVAIGLLVDLGHYRWVRAAARYNGSFIWGGFTRWTFAILMTVVSLVYHERFYSDLWLSVPLPFLIASLAWLSKVDANVGRKQSHDTKPETHNAKPELHVAIADAPVAKPITQAVQKCSVCGEAILGNAGAHTRWHCKGKN